jgi:protein-disulfide isomerase
MSTTPRLTKRELREERRAARVAAEDAARAEAARKRRLTMLGGLVAVAAVVVAVAVAVSSHGAKKAATPAATSSSAAKAAAIVAGIPERNGVLGSSSAKVTVTEYLDLQCPICKAASQQVVPGLVSSYVRTGKVKLEPQTLHFIGSDSTRAAEVAAGARAQGRFWAFAEAFYASQGEENSGYVTDSFLRNVAKASGVDATKALAYANTTAAEAPLNAADSSASKLGIDSTPTFVVQKAGGAPQITDAAHVDATIKKALA